MTPRLPLRSRRARAALLGALLVAGLAASVEAGHEVPYYPSFYPQEIGIERLEAGAAAAGLRKNLQAYVGADPFAGAALPADVASVTSLRSWLVVTFPARGRGTGDAASRCGAAARIGRGLAGKGAWVPFAYPVTPYHADYLGHADRVEEARRRAETAGAERNPPIPKLRASGRLAQGLAAAGLPSGGGEGSPVVEEIAVDDLLTPERTSVNGWLGPSFLKEGWFQAYLLQAPALGEPSRRVADELFHRRVAGGAGPVDRLNLERRLVSALTRDCDRVVLGYALRREAINVAYSNGIENVAWDPQAGLDSGIFLRTAKLKDFPWNGWMRVGLPSRPTAAWNPIGGFTDPAGRLIWEIVGDPALLPSPHDGGWIANRVIPGAAQEAAVPADALAPVPGSGVFRPATPGPGTAVRISYRVLASKFHDGSDMTAADLVYPYAFAARWSAAERRGAGGYDPEVDRATAPARQALLGLKVMRLDKETKDLGDLKLVLDVPQVDVWLRPGLPEGAAAVVAPPWSTLPWTVLALMDEAVTSGLGAFSEAEARRRGVPWLDLARDPRTRDALRALAARLEHDVYVPEPLRPWVKPGEARQRWAQLRGFMQERGHALVTNGPYSLQKWTADGATLQVFRDLSYPLIVGTFDRFALPLRGFVEKVERQGDRLVVTAEVERVIKAPRTYSIRREPLAVEPPGDRPRDFPACHYVVIGGDGEVAAAGVSRQLDVGRTLVIDLGGRLKPGAYRVALAVVLDGNLVNPEVSMTAYTVAGG